MALRCPCRAAGIPQAQRVAWPGTVPEVGAGHSAEPLSAMIRPWDGHLLAQKGQSGAGMSEDQTHEQMREKRLKRRGDATASMSLQLLRLQQARSCDIQCHYRRKEKGRTMPAKMI
eukprot:scaffold28721_cov16-Tisochrysis_lutea.AAC.1